MPFGRDLIRKLLKKKAQWDYIIVYVKVTNLLWNKHKEEFFLFKEMLKYYSIAFLGDNLHCI